LAPPCGHSVHGFWGNAAPHGCGFVNANSMITDNLKTIQSHMNGYDAKLIAVSKQQPDDRIEQALDAGIRIYGENKVQEAQGRWAHRRKEYSDLKLHLIGPLQSNKVKDACDLFDVIHTLDREKLVQKIHNYHPSIPCLIQVNTAEETQKSGILINELNDFHAFCLDLKMNICRFNAVDITW